MKFAKKKYKWIGILCFAIMLFRTLPVSASVPGAASITIFYHGVTPQEESVALSGAEFNLYKVGVYQENKWVLDGAFAGCDVFLDDMSASGQLKVVKQIMKYVETQQIQGKSQMTDQDGSLFFAGLENGLYLIVPGGEVMGGGGVFRSDAFLVQIPETDEDGNQIYDITVEPKNEWVSDEKEPGERPEEKPEDKPEQKPEDTPLRGDNVKTGDNTPVELLFKISAVSVIIIALLILRKNHNKRNKEDLNE